MKFEFFSKRADKITILEPLQISKLDVVYSLLPQILCARLRSNSLQSSIAFGTLLGDPEGRNCKSSHQRSSVKKGVLRNFTKFTGKHLRQSLFFNKVAGGACNFIKKETRAQVFSCEFCEIFKNTFFTEHLRTTASETFMKFSKTCFPPNYHF